MNQQFQSQAVERTAFFPQTGLAANTDGIPIDTFGFRTASFYLGFGATVADGKVKVQHADAAAGPYTDIEDDFTTIGTTQLAEYDFVGADHATDDAKVCYVEVDSHHTKRFLRMTVEPGGATDCFGWVNLFGAADARQSIGANDKRFGRVMGQKN